MAPPPTRIPSTRRRQRQVQPISVRRSVYEWTIIILLLSASTVGIILFGAVRNWSAGSLMVLVFLGITLFFLRPLFDRQSLELRIPPGGLWIALFACYTAALIPFASVPYEAKVELLKVGSYVGAYFAWAGLASRAGRWRIILFIPLLIGTLVALYALISHVQGSTMVLNMERDVGYGMRASGTFMAPAHLGAYMGTMICLGLTLMLMPSANALLRLFGGYGLLVFLPTLFLSGSRSGWVGALIGVPVILLMRASRRGLRAFLVTLTVFPVAAVLLVAALWFASPMFQERVHAAVKLEGTAASRLDMWADTWVMIKDRPVVGHGPGSYRWMYPPYQQWEAGESRWLRYAHNEYMHLVAEYGLVGLTLMAVFVLALLARCLTLFRRAETDRDAGLAAGFTGALCAALGHAVFDFNLHVFSLVHLLALFGGVTMAGFYRPSALKAKELSFPAAAAVMGGLALVALTGAFISFQVAASGALVRLAEDRVGQMDLFSANPYEREQRYYERAGSIDPSNWLPYLELGDIHRSRAFWIRDREYKEEKAREALAYYEQAVERNPYDMNAIYGIGRCWYILGDEEKSLEYLRRTVEYWPNNVFYAKQLGLQLREMERYEEALEAFHQARRGGGRQDPIVRANIALLERQLRQP